MITQEQINKIISELEDRLPRGSGITLTVKTKSKTGTIHEVTYPVTPEGKVINKPLISTVSKVINFEL